MKQMAIITVLTLITVTQAFSQVATRPGQRGLPTRDIGPINRGPYFPTPPPQAGHNRGFEKRIQLNFNSHYQGQSTIKLKQELKFQYPALNIQDLDLVSAQIIAKSKQGYGEATLLVGQAESYPTRIAGNPYDFQNPSHYTFDNKTIFNPSYDSNGIWQIELRGNILVKGIVLTVKEKYTQAYPKQETIYMRGAEYNAFSTFKLKQLIKQNNPRVDLEQADIVSVTLMAKSKFGNGQASLKVGQSITYPTTIPGNPREFNVTASRSFTPVQLFNNTGGSQGVWQVELQGNIKVDYIVVTYKEYDPYGNSFPGRNGGGRR